MTVFPHAVVLAAGRGERMLPMTAQVPKPLMGADGHILLQEQLQRLGHAAARLHVTVGHLGALVAAAAVEYGADSVLHVGDRGNAWWLAGTLFAAVDAPVLVSTCDNFLDIDLTEVHRAYVRAGFPPCMLVPTAPRPGTPGDWIRADGMTVVGLDRDLPTERYASGLQVLNPRTVLEIAGPADDFGALWQRLISQRALRVADIAPRGFWAVDRLEDLDGFADWLASSALPRPVP